jgi:hypothetical protein
MPSISVPNHMNMAMNPAVPQNVYRVALHANDRSYFADGDGIERGVQRTRFIIELLSYS